MWLVFGMLLSLCLLRPGSVSAQLVGNEQKCVNTANENAQKIGDAPGKYISSCIIVSPGKCRMRGAITWPY